MYKAIEPFIDLQDSNRAYKPGDVFPREGLNVSESRIADLASASNRRGRPVIQLVEEPKKPVEKPAEKPEKEPIEEPVKETVEKPKRGRKKKNAD